MDRRLEALESPDVASDEFITLFTAAGRAASGTHLEEKVVLLAAAVESAADPRTENDFMAMRFVRYVDELEVEHFHVLRALADGQVAINGTPLGPHVRSVVIGGVTGEQLEVCISDLDREGLAARENGQMGAALRTPEETWTVTIRPRGRQLLGFVRLLADSDS